MIWFSFLLLGVLGVSLLFLGFAQRRPVLLFVSAVFLILMGMFLFGQGIEIPTGSHATVDANMTVVDSNLTYTTYTTNNDLVLQFLAWLSLIIGLLLAVTGFVFWAR